MRPTVRPSRAPDLAVVMPIYNEAANVRPVVREWFACLDALGVDFAFFAVNDGSTDNTAEVLAELTKEFGSRLRLITKPNSGHGKTCREGYELALAEGARWIFQADSDGQCDPAFFREFYAACSEQDCLFGYRRTREDGWGRIAVGFCCRAALLLLTGTYLRDPNVPYRMIRAAALRSALRRIPADFELQNIGLTFALSRDPDLRWKHFPIHFRARRGGENSINYRKIVRLGFNLLRDFRRLRTDEASRWQRPAWMARGAVS